MRPFIDYLIILTGPKALTYDEVALIIGRARGRAVRHIQLSGAELASRYRQGGLPPDYAATLAEMDVAVSRGESSETTGCFEQLTGSSPTSFKAFADRDSATWR